jgi:sodium-dependent dicarboxylate transporter 2/3/5
LLHLVDTRRQLRRLLGGLEVDSPRAALTFVLCLLAGWGAYAAASRWGGLTEAPARALFILVAAAALWVTEAAPAFAVGILVIALEVLLLADAGGAQRLGGAPWESYIAVLGHPLVWLFFGGFVLAAGTARTGLDRWLAARALGRFGSRPASVLAGVMTVTFGFSMFMSNTATTALMLALLAPVAALLAPNDPFKKALFLGTALAANVGGMGSLIGTPPNALAAGALSELPGHSIGFLEWMAFGLPPASLLSIIGWLYLLRRYPAAAVAIDVRLIAAGDGAARESPRWRRWIVMATGIGTVVLWMTGGWHQAPTAVVSLLSIVVFTTTAVLRPTDIRGLPWDVLFLLAGGLALGDAIKSTGLADWMVAKVPLHTLGPLAMALALGYVVAIVSNFMSNTAAANVLIPIAISVSVGFEDQVVLPVAIAASAAMCLPIATPPNALVFSTGQVESADFVRSGLLLGGLAPLLAALWVLVVR